MHKRQFPWLRIVAHLGGLVPLSLLLWRAATHHLTANPIQFITQRTGYAALVFLVLSLVCTPLNTILAIKQLQLPSLRRPLGLYAFFYASLHLMTFLYDFNLDPELIIPEVSEKLYLLLGFGAFLLMLPLAITSTKGWIRRMGKRWKLLHRVVYAAALLGVYHYFWTVKADIREPMLYGTIVVVLLALRLPTVRKTIGGWRSRLSSGSSAQRLSKSTPEA